MSDDLSIPNPGYRGNRASRYNRAASRRDSGMDPDTRRLMMFAGVVGAALMVLISASMLTSHHGGQIPVIAADPAPLRVRPENPGGLKIDAAENDVFAAGTDTRNAALAPPAEAPDTKALQAVEAPARPAVLADTDPASSAAPAPALPLLPAPAAAAVAAATPAPSVPVYAPPPADTHAAADHRITVQLAAMTSNAGAMAEWDRLSHRFHDLFNGHEADISRIDHDGHEFWRLRASGFADLAQARSFCERLRAKGGGCLVVEY